MQFFVVCLVLFDVVFVLKKTKQTKTTLANSQSLYPAFACCSLDDDDSGESQEVLEDQLTRQLTREYLELLSKVAVFGEALCEETYVKEEISAAGRRRKRGSGTSFSVSSRLRSCNIPHS